jgi:hypothetical protein
MGSAGSIAVVCAFSLVGGVSNGIECCATMTASQELTAEEQQARVGGLLESIVAGATGIGFLVGGVVATLASARAVYVAAGLAILPVTVLLLAPPAVIADARDILRAVSGRGSASFPARPKPSETDAIPRATSAIRPRRPISSRCSPRGTTWIASALSPLPRYRRRRPALDY